MTNGKSAPTIAAQLKRTTRSVRRRAEVLKLSWKGNSISVVGSKPDPVASTSAKIDLVANPRWTPEEDDRLRRLVEEGRSAAVISADHDCSPTVIDAARQRGLRIVAVHP